MGLTAATYLGDNTVPILEGLLAAIRGASVDISIDVAAGRTSADARARAGSVDLVWMCGSLSRVLLDEEVMSHEVVAAPVFAGERAATYRSVLIARSDGPAAVGEALEGTVASNEPESWSGHHGLRRHLDDRWFEREVWTGSHRGSIQAVVDGRAEVAGIDVTVWEHTVRSEPDLTVDLEVIDRTADWPAPPFLLHPRVAGAQRSTLLATLMSASVPGLTAMVPASAADYDELRPLPRHPG